MKALRKARSNTHAKVTGKVAPNVKRTSTRSVKGKNLPSGMKMNKSIKAKRTHK